MCEDARMAAQRLVVTSGHPTAPELGAIVAALAEHRSRSAVSEDVEQSRWIQAARLEGCGHQPIDNPARLMAY